MLKAILTKEELSKNVKSAFVTDADHAKILCANILLIKILKKIFQFILKARLDDYFKEIGIFFLTLNFFPS